MSTFSEWALVVAWRKSFGKIDVTVSAPEPEPQEYVDARTEAREVARNLGLDIGNEHWEKSSIADFLRLCYAQGWKACERKVMSPDRADDIALAIEHPEKVVEHPPFGGNGKLDWQIRAVQQAAAYGVPK